MTNSITDLGTKLKRVNNILLRTNVPLQALEKSRINLDRDYSNVVKTKGKSFKAVKDAESKLQKIVITKRFKNSAFSNKNTGRLSIHTRRKGSALNSEHSSSNFRDNVDFQSSSKNIDSSSPFLFNAYNDDSVSFRNAVALSHASGSFKLISK